MFFLTIPHCSVHIPPELQPRLNPEANLRAMAEPGLDLLFALPGVETVAGDVHLSVVNLNRSRDDINPRTGDPYPETLSQNVLADFHGMPLYRADAEHSPVERKNFLQLYYDPFSSRWTASSPPVVMHFFVDIHSMNEDSTSYVSKTDSLGGRPDMCLGNDGDPAGRRIRTECL